MALGDTMAERAEMARRQIQSRIEELKVEALKDAEWMFNKADDALKKLQSGFFGAADAGTVGVYADSVQGKLEAIAELEEQLRTIETIIGGEQGG